VKRWITLTLTGAAAAWLLGLAFGLQRLAAFENRPGPDSPFAAAWPTDAPTLNSAGYTLAIFLHPKCSCSTATVAELDEIMAHDNNTIHAYVFAELPENAPADWQSAGLIASAKTIPHVTIVQDKNCHFADEFGARTSGQTELFDSTGKCVFSGGITPSRGHEGDSAGKSAIEAIVTGQTTTVPGTPVFGCSLSDRTRSLSK
jgi:hypothetical protein